MSWLIEARGLRADLIALLAGAMAALALPPLHVLPVLLVAFPVLLMLIRACGRSIAAARRGWWFGFGYHLVGLYWITEAILFEAARFWWLVPLAVPALAAVLALFVAAASWAAWWASGTRQTSGLQARPEAPSPLVQLAARAPAKGETLCNLSPGQISEGDQPGGSQVAVGSPQRSALSNRSQGVSPFGGDRRGLGREERTNARWWGIGTKPRAQATTLPFQVMALAGAWVLADMARQFVLTGFPWNPLGSVWAVPGQFGDVMLQPASLVSVHGLTLATVLLACAPVLRWRGRAVSVAVFVTWIGFGVSRITAPPPPDQNLAVVLIQGNVAQGQKWDPTLVAGVFERYLRLTDEGLRDAGSMPHVAVWPETASFYQLDTDQAAREAIASAGRGGPVLAGAVRFGTDDRPRNTLFAVTGAGTIAAAYDKWHLVPFGEYQPSWAQIGIQLVPGGGFAPGPGPKTLRIPGVPPVGPLICYEAIFPGQVINESDRPEWMVNVTNDAWFGTSSGPRQHLAAARLRAVEEGVPILRAANTGITVAFDARGHEIARIGMEQAGFLVVTLPGALPRTVFARLGLMLPAALAAWMLGLGLVMSHRRRSG